MRNDIETTEWEELKPSSPFYFFVPRKDSYWDIYEKFWKITDIFPVNCTGIVTARDKFVIDFDREPLRRRIEMFRDLSLSDDFIRQSFNLKDTRGWKLSEMRRKLANDEKWDTYFTKILYRPFDIRDIYYTPKMVDWPRPEVMRHMMRENISLCAMRQVALDEKYTHFLVSQYMVDNRTFLSSKGIIQQFPLYIYHDNLKGKLLDEKAPKSERVPNISKDFLHALKKVLGTEPTSEEIFYYIYAVLYSPTYRKRYEEFLKVDFPRIPLPSDTERFKKLSELGKELVELHLLKHPTLQERVRGIGFPMSGSNKVEKVKYDEKTERVYFNKEQYFEGIPKAVWEYQIGGYQVAEKYLKDRKKRELSRDEIEHYMKVVKAIEMTIEVQRRIENVF